jgi:opacity protein-like surface antigen
MASSLFLGVATLVLILAGSTAPALAEGFVDLYVGAGVTRDSDFKVEVAGAGSDTQRFEWSTSPTAGGRCGFWLTTPEWLGLAIDASVFVPDGDLAVFPLSALVMLRLPLLKGQDFPRGRLHPYIAAGPGVFISDLSGDLGDAGGEVSDTSVDVGVDARAGLAFSITKAVALFAEYRFTRFEPEFTLNILGVRTRSETTLETHHVLGGVGFRF